jgi:hypothetical protein
VLVQNNSKGMNGDKKYGSASSKRIGLQRRQTDSFLLLATR